MRPASDAGQATIELALCLPVVAAVLGLVVGAAGIATDHVRLWHAAREAARVAAVDAGADEIHAAAAAGGLDHLDVDVEPEAHARIRGEPVTVTISYRPAADIPLLGRLARGVVMSARATMRIERP